MIKKPSAGKKRAPRIKHIESDHQKEHTWTFLSNHSHVIICLARDPEIRMRDIAIAVGITERAAIRIVTELEDGGYIRKERIGRRNHYTILPDKNFRHPLEARHSIKSILALAKP
ncbi:MAG: helix-turn-helix transcriptional regulator [Pseudomonadota bacterium]